MHTRTRAVILISLAAVLLILAGAVLFRSNQPARSGAAAPGPVELSGEQDEYPLGARISILEDPGSRLSIDQVASPEFAGRFIPSQSEVPNFGFTDSAFWLRLSLDNQSERTSEWLLELGFANMQYADLYVPQPGGGFIVRKIGSLRPAETRDILYPKLVFDLSLPAGSPQTFYLRLQSGASMTLALTLWARNAFISHSQRELMLHWLLYGALLALLIYHLFILFMVREASYFYFVAMLAALLFADMSYTGYLETYLVPGLYRFKALLFPLTFVLFITAIIRFSDVFLELKLRQPRFHQFHLACAGFGGFMALVMLVFGAPIAVYVISLLWTLVALGASIVAGLIAWRQGFHSARLVLLAWLGMAVSLMLVMLVRLAVLPSTLLNENLYELGVIWMAICWSFAMADRINALKAQTELANRELRSSQGRLSQILEAMPLGVVLYGRDLKPRYINQRTTELISSPDEGILPDPTYQRTLPQAIHYFSLKQAGSQEDYPLEQIPVSSALRGQPANADDVEIQRGQQRIPLEMWASPVLDEAGQVDAAVLVFQDVTARKQAEAELDEYRKNLECLVEERTTALDAANNDLRLRLEWVSAIGQVAEIMARSSDFTEIYARIVEIINRLFATRDSFILEFDADRRRLKVLAHSCCDLDQSALIGSYTALPEGSLPESGEPVFISGEALQQISGPFGRRIQEAGLQNIALAPLTLREQVFGFLGLELYDEGRVITGEGARLLSVFSLDIAQLIEDSRLFEQSKALITAEERNRLARELHDSVTQTLFTASVLAEATPRIWERQPELARQNLEKLSRLIRGALAEMRSMLIELRAGDLQRQTLDQLISTLVDAARARSRSQVVASIAEIHGLPQNVTLAFYRIAREALNNALVHAAADQIEVRLSTTAGGAELRIRDDGCGFDPLEMPAGHLGLRIIRERAAEIGARVAIDSQPGQGTEIAVVWPDPAQGAAERE